MTHDLKFVSELYDVNKKKKKSTLISLYDDTDELSSSPECVLLPELCKFVNIVKYS